MLHTWSDAEIRKMACKNVNEDPKRLESDIEAIREWLAKQPHLQTVPTDEKNMLRFLRFCKFSLERTKERIDKFYTLKALAPETYRGRDPTLPALINVFRVGMYLPVLEKVDPQGRRILVVRCSAWNPETQKVEDVIKGNLMLGDLLVDMDEHLQVAGVVMVVDFQGVSITQTVQYSPSFIKQQITMMQDGYPIRPQGMHWINLSPSFAKIASLVKSFLSPKLKERMHVHEQSKGFESLHKHIPKNCLPKEYGGTCGDVTSLAKKWEKLALDRKDWYAANELQVSHEEKRIGKPKTAEEVYGVVGSFRKLDLD